LYKRDDRRRISTDRIQIAAYVTTEVLRERKVDLGERRFQTKRKKCEENSKRKINEQNRTKQREDERKEL
jgi:hypothetical protein